MTDALSGRNVVVVGVGSEMGKACVVRCLAEGARVLAVDPSEHELTRLVEIAGSDRLQTFAAAHGDEHGIDSVVAHCAELWSKIDGLVVTPSYFDWWTDEEESMELWEEVLRIGLLMPIFYVRRLRALLTASGDASVVFYGSIDGTYGNPRVPAYSVARGGLIPAVHVLAHALGPEGVRVNVIAGAAIRSPGPDAPEVRWPLANPTELLRANAIRRRARPEEVASVVQFLLGPDSSYLTGAVIPLDAGRMAITAGTGLAPDIADD